MEITPEIQQASMTLAREDFIDYSILSYPGFKLGWHIELLGKKLMEVAEGKIKRLMVFMPPRHSKSVLCSQLFPSWYIGKYPKNQIITATYGDQFATDFGRFVRNTIKDPLFSKIFPGVYLAEDSQAKNRFNTNQGGIYVSTGLGGAITGRGAHLFLIDDPVKGRKEADSEVERENVWAWYQSVARTRLMPNAAVVLILTRWHKDDLAGRLMRKMKEDGEQWEILELPALATKDDQYREEGEALWPEQWPKEELLKTKSAIDQREWYCLYQQTPIDPENQIFHSEYFRYYDELPPEELTTLITVDPAFKKRKTSDYSVIMAVAKYQDKTYVLDYVRQRLNPSELINEIIRMYKKWKPYKVGIESFAAQTVIGFYLQEKAQQEGLMISYDEILQKDDKLTKIKRLEPYFREGKILIKKHMTDLEKELLEFPQGDHDDIMDALQMSYEFRIFDIVPKNNEWDYFSNLGVNYSQQYNKYGEPVY